MYRTCSEHRNISRGFLPDIEKNGYPFFSIRRNPYRTDKLSITPFRKRFAVHTPRTVNADTERNVSTHLISSFESHTCRNYTYRIDFSFIDIASKLIIVVRYPSPIHVEYHVRYRLILILDTQGRTTIAYPRRQVVAIKDEKQEKGIYLLTNQDCITNACRTRDDIITTACRKQETMSLTSACRNNAYIAYCCWG